MGAAHCGPPLRSRRATHCRFDRCGYMASDHATPPADPPRATDHGTLSLVPNRNSLASPWWLLPPGRVRPLWWVPVAAGWMAIEYIGGPYAAFPVLYVIPVILAAWYSGRRSAVTLALAIPVAHIVMLLVLWPTAVDVASLVAATILRGAVILLLAFWFARLSEHERALHRHVRRLEGLLPICCFCKNIRTKSGEWEPIETYISNRSEAQFSHGFCPDCGKEHYAEYEYDDAATG